VTAESENRSVVPLGRGNFFAVDRRVWAKVCEVGINEAVAYLVLARGTLRDMRTTSWSVNAIEDRTNIARHRAKVAIEALLKPGIVRRDKGGFKPRYYLLPANGVPGCEASPPPAMDEIEAQLHAQLATGKTWVSDKGGKEWHYNNPRTIARRLVELERARDLGNGHFAAVIYDPEAASRPDWIWLPNSIIDGAAGETPPIELIRQSQRPSALRLFVDLYHAQGLARDGGVHWRQLRRVYERHKVGERGIYVIWGFREVTTEAWGTAFFVAPHLTGQTEMVKQLDGTIKHEDPGWPEFWQALGILTSTGLVDFVGHVVDADTEAGNVLHPYAVGNGEEAERTIADLAHLAGQAMVTDGQRSWAEGNGLLLLPVPKHVEQVQLVGLARLKYRARTTATAAWFGSAEEWASWARSYEQLRMEALCGSVAQPFATSTGHQWGIKGRSTGDQR
jgi:hypothetical protein